jgi:hypothetical protein
VSGEICSNTTGQEIHHILWEFKVHWNFHMSFSLHIENSYRSKVIDNQKTGMNRKWFSIKPRNILLYHL